MPIGLTNIGWKMYMVNASWDIIILFLIMYFWVETRGKTLEEIDALFEGVKHSDVPDVELVRKGVAQIDGKVVEEEIVVEVGAMKEA
jgi:hypothetical protein